MGHLGLRAVLATLFVVVASQGVVMPNGVALAMIPYGQAAGSASAYLGVQQFLIAAVVSPLAGLGGASAGTMAAVMAVVSCLGLLTFVVFTRGPAACADTGDLLAARMFPSATAD
jgi:DHA1 family bicyclomycin/chloramphenicol resistance-like MFS transporter